MKKIVCEMCEGTDFIKENGLFVCETCGCKYSLEDARKMMRDFDDEPRANHTQEQTKQQEAPKEKTIPKHSPNSLNRLFVEVTKVGHETYTMKSVMSLSTLFGESEPEFVEGPDQVGHIGAEISLQNLGGKIIKYATIYVVPYNMVGDAQKCSVTDVSMFGIEVTGPITVGEQRHGHVDGIWYNHSIVSARIDHVHVIYMDDTEEIYEGTEFYAANNFNPNNPYQEQSTRSLCIVNIFYDAVPSAPQELWYSWDNDNTKNKVYCKNSARDALIPGRHVLNILNPFMKKSYEFDVTTDMNISITGKAFSMQVDFV